MADNGNYVSYKNIYVRTFLRIISNILIFPEDPVRAGPSRLAVLSFSKKCLRQIGSDAFKHQGRDHVDISCSRDCCRERGSFFILSLRGIKNIIKILCFILKLKCRFNRAYIMFSWNHLRLLTAEMY